MAVKDAVAVAMAVVCVGIAVAVLVHPKEPTPESFVALICDDTLKNPRVVGISTKIYMNHGIYFVRDTHGDLQTYRPSAFEWCATMNAADAKKAGLIE